MLIQNLTMIQILFKNYSITLFFKICCNMRASMYTKR